MTRHELDDEEWGLVEPFLPIGRYGPYPQRLRDQFEGVVWRFRSGSTWRELPEEFGNWQTVYDRFAQWCDAGVFAFLTAELSPGAARRDQADMSLVTTDSPAARAHHDDAARAVVGPEVLAALQEAAAEEKRRRKPGGPSR
ncbi:transposase [Streptomyces sp. NPDC051130]|uniref:transposase n=1 Tax=Streptomyces sp. NPDC051130 TaxID=3157223 RepID=UPI003421E505